MEPEDIVRRALEAERIQRKSQAEKERRKWLQAKCPKCGYRFEYAPTAKFRGIIKCPECGEEFKIPRLDDWAE